MAKKAEPKKTGAKPKTAEKKGAAKSKSTAEKTVKKTPAKKTAAKAKRAPNPAFMKPMQISDELAKVVGSKPIPRTEVTKKLWAYIKKNNLQDAANKRDIIADENLKPIFGGKSKVSMFEMTKLVNKHLS
jgi:upstream activation factor subunit UAF30